MPRVLIVVARTRQELFEYFQHVFAGMQDIKVILDRRIGPADPPVSGDEPERRERQDVYDEIQQRGFVVIRLW